MEEAHAEAEALVAALTAADLAVVALVADPEADLAVVRAVLIGDMAAFGGHAIIDLTATAMAVVVSAD